MRIATWNVNSARARVDRMTAALTRHDIDVLAVQETKCTDEQFPTQAFEDLGYEVAHFGLNQWNGVAIISRVGLGDVEKQFPDQPGFPEVEARAIGATCGGVRVWSLYVPNGREIADPHYDYKLRWLWALADYVRSNPAEQLALMGDFNIAPRDTDVWDPDFFRGKTHVTEPERAAFEMLIDAGLNEVATKEPYTYWDYTQGRFQKNEGMRIDFQLVNDALYKKVRASHVDVDERSGRGASDHTLLIVDYDVADFDSVR